MLNEISLKLNLVNTQRFDMGYYPTRVIVILSTPRS
ncbi:MAG: hypothetical protein ACI9E1_001557 [Cryomorphaceae bacterium]